MKQSLERSVFGTILDSAPPRWLLTGESNPLSAQKPALGYRRGETGLKAGSSATLHTA